MRKLNVEWSVLLSTSIISGLIWIQVWVVEGLPEKAQIAIGGVGSVVNLAIFMTIMVGGVIGPVLFFIARMLRKAEEYSNKSHEQNSLRNKK